MNIASTSPSSLKWPTSASFPDATIRAEIGPVVFDDLAVLRSVFGVEARPLAQETDDIVSRLE